MARELRAWDPLMMGTFAATPPLECLKLVLSNFMTEPKDKFEEVARGVRQFSEQTVH